MKKRYLKLKQELANVDFLLSWFDPDIPRSVLSGKWDAKVFANFARGSSTMNDFRLHEQKRNHGLEDV